MQIAIEAKSGLEQEISITIPASDIHAKQEAKLNKLSKEVKLPGFRPGKVPVSVVRTRFGEEVRKEVSAEAMQEGLMKAIEEHKLKLTTDPEVTETKMDAGQDVSFKATVEVFPEFELVTLQDQAIEKFQVEVTDADIQDTLETMRKQHTAWEAVERAVQEGDRVMIDFEGKVDGEAFDGNSAEEFKFVVGNKTMLPDFEAAVVGKLVSETPIQATVVFPKDYHHSPLAEKTAIFDITLKGVEGPTLPELNDDFAVTAGIKEGGMETLKAELRTTMETEVARAIKTKLKDGICETWLGLNDIPLPQRLVTLELNDLIEQAKQRQRMDTLPEAKVAQLRIDAEKRVKLGLLFSKYVEMNKIETDSKVLNTVIEDMVSMYQASEEMLSFYYQNEQLMKQASGMAIEQQAIEKLLQDAKTSDKTLSYKELMHQH